MSGSFDNFSFKLTLIMSVGPEKLKTLEKHIIRVPAKTATRQAQKSFLGQTVLCLDGQGIRGYASLVVLHALVEEIAKQEFEFDRSVHDSYNSPLFQGADRDPFGVEQRDVPPSASSIRLCHYFDYIAGSSTGGIIALMLGTMRCPIDEARARTRALWTCVLPMFSSLRMTFPPPRHKRKNSHMMTKRLEDMQPDTGDSGNHVSSLDRSTALVDIPTMLGTDDNTCQTIVFATHTAENGLVGHFAFRSYESSVDKAEIKAADACRATCALPGIFNEVRIPGVSGSFRDGSLWRVNPIEDVYKEVGRRQREQLASGHFYLEGILSIGGRDDQGESTARKVFGGSPDREQPLNEDDEPSFARTAAKLGLTYHRLECVTSPKRSTNINRILDHIESEASKYCTKPDVRATLERCAKMLVRNRQRRSRTVQWEQYAGLERPRSVTLNTGVSTALASRQSRSTQRTSTSYSLQGIDTRLSRTLSGEQILEHEIVLNGLGT